MANNFNYNMFHIRFKPSHISAHQMEICQGVWSVCCMAQEADAKEAICYRNAHSIKARQECQIPESLRRKGIDPKAYKKYY